MLIVGNKNKIYYRGTNNLDEEKLIKDKSIRPSINHITKKSEIGLSVSDTKTVGKHFKYLYSITGKEIGIGSDGEPLLDIKSIKFIKWEN